MAINPLLEKQVDALQKVLQQMAAGQKVVMDPTTPTFQDTAFARLAVSAFRANTLSLLSENEEFMRWYRTTPAVELTFHLWSVFSGESH